ncbi:MAG: ATPase [Alphaproteobacteria bacterium]|nr:ATPase [Alphaproteobacteria bacterium]
MSDCCGTEAKKKHGPHFDPILHGSLAVIALTLILSFAHAPIPNLDHFAHTIIDFLKTMWWGILMGMVFVGVMNKIPREYFNHLLGKGDKFPDILKAAAAGVLLDLCSHGILMIGAKLYERGASYAQLLTFLIASPWNSFSLTLILISLIGFKWTLTYILASMLIAIITGVIVMMLTKRGKIPANPYTPETDKNFNFKTNALRDLKAINWSPKFIIEIFTGSTHELKILLKWLLLGVIIASAIRAFVPLDFFQTFFGPTLIGLLLTLIATSIIEVCSEGSAPIASEIVNTAGAAGNGFTFLMAGVATDYTEIMVLKETTKSWKLALILPLITVPQIIVLGYIFNNIAI